MDEGTWGLMTASFGLPWARKMMKKKAGTGICTYLRKGPGLFGKVYYSWTAVPGLPLAKLMVSICKGSLGKCL